MEAVIVLAVLGGLVLAAWRLLRVAGRLLLGRSPPAAAAESLLDVVLMLWQPGDELTLRELLNGGVVILGRPGSGKSSSSSYQLLQACVDLPESGGLILAASLSDLEMVEHIFRRQPGRLLVFDERSGHRFNVLNYLARRGSLKDVVEAIYAIVESVDRSGGSGGGGNGEASFFDKGARLIVEYCVTVVYLATGTLNPADILKFLNTAAQSKEELKSEAFDQSFHAQCFAKADAKQKTEVQENDYALAVAYFSDAFPAMADRTRTSLTAVVLNVLHTINTGLNRLLFGTTTTITPKAMDRGQWIFVNMPANRGTESAFALSVWKFVTEWHTLQRDTRRHNPPLIIHADEIHNIINKYDTRYLGECRKFSGCMIACTQSRASFYANMGGEAAEAQVDALMNNFTYKIIHSLGDVDTAKWAAELVGEATMIEGGGSEQLPRDAVEEWLGQGLWMGNYHETRKPVMTAADFMQGFRTGGARHGNLCDAVVIRSGESFSTGTSYLRLAFRQPDLRR